MNLSYARLLCLATEAFAMKNLILYGVLIAFAVFSAAPTIAQDTNRDSREASTAVVQKDTYGDQLGTVIFPVSCDEVASRHVQRGVALLHHMTYEAARVAFTNATEVDPDCSMGYWRQAMSIIHPLWSDPPNQTGFQRGKTLVKLIQTGGKRTEREDAYILKALSL